MKVGKKLRRVQRNPVKPPAPVPQPERERNPGLVPTPVPRPTSG